MVKIFANTISTKAINVQDVDLVFTIYACNHDSGVVGLLGQAKGKVYRSKNIKAFTTEIPIAVLLT